MKWVEAHPEIVGDGYSFSKEAIVVYVQKRAAELAKKGIDMLVDAVHKISRRARSPSGIVRVPMASTSIR